MDVCVNDFNICSCVNVDNTNCQESIPWDLMLRCSYVILNNNLIIIINNNNLIFYFV